MTAEHCTSCLTSASAKPDDNFVQLHIRARVTLALDPFHLELRVLEQFLGLPGATARAQLKVQLCGKQRRAEQQGPDQSERFQ